MSSGWDVARRLWQQMQTAPIAPDQGHRRLGQRPASGYTERPPGTQTPETIGGALRQESEPARVVPNRRPVEDPLRLGRGTQSLGPLYAGEALRLRRDPRQR